MLVKNKDTAIQTFLGPETTLEGKLAFEGTVRLDGHFTGSIESKDGIVIIGDDAVIRADVWVHTALISGEVSGNIRATHCIELHPPAQIYGDINAPTVVIEPGVVFRGNCVMGQAENTEDNMIRLAERQS
jgi:cytoskeletal protein CcmA (bactofilin family)